MRSGVIRRMTEAAAEAGAGSSITSPRTVIRVECRSCGARLQRRWRAAQLRTSAGWPPAQEQRRPCRSAHRWRGLRREGGAGFVTATHQPHRGQDMDCHRGLQSGSSQAPERGGGYPKKTCETRGRSGPGEERLVLGGRLPVCKRNVAVPQALGRPRLDEAFWPGEERGRHVRNHLPVPTRIPHAPGMFVVSETEAAAIRTAFDQGGELSAALELRRLFPGITDNAQARACARTIAGWQPPPVRSPPVTRLRPGKARPLGKRTLPGG